MWSRGRSGARTCGGECEGILLREGGHAVEGGGNERGHTVMDKGMGETRSRGEGMDEDMRSRWEDMVKDMRSRGRTWVS